MGTLDHEKIWTRDAIENCQFAVFNAVFNCFSFMVLKGGGWLGTLCGYVTKSARSVCRPLRPRLQLEPSPQLFMYLLIYPLPTPTPTTPTFSPSSSLSLGRKRGRGAGGYLSTYINSTRGGLAPRVAARDSRRPTEPLRAVSALRAVTHGNPLLACWRYGNAY